MHTRVVKPKHGPELVVRPLKHGDTATVQAVFERLGDASRRARFHGLKHRLGEQELRWLATVGPNHLVLVAYVDDDPQPEPIPRLVRPGARAEAAFEVADPYQGHGIGSPRPPRPVPAARGGGGGEGAGPRPGH